MEGGLRTELRPMLVGDIVGQFFVLGLGYQRGYRWGRDEVTRLLDDISESSGRKYFLQPVVAKRRDDGKWELVDGQQRLTTLLLILRYIHEHLPTVHPKYSLEYETRPGSANYLDHPAPEQSQDNIDFPLRAQCTTCKTGRKLVLHQRDDLLRQARADWAATGCARTTWPTGPTWNAPWPRWPPGGDAGSSSAAAL